MKDATAPVALFIIAAGAAYIAFNSSGDDGDDAPDADPASPGAGPSSAAADAVSSCDACVAQWSPQIAQVVGENSGALDLHDADLGVLLAAICNRETAGGTTRWLTPPAGGAAATGDSGHGHGLMQIDDRSHAEFCAGDDWKDPYKNFSYALTQVLIPMYQSLGDLRQTIAAYNCGMGNVRKAIKRGLDVDTYTAADASGNHNYSADVISHARGWGFQALAAGT